MVFVIDSSTSIGSIRFQLIRQFAANIAGLLDIGPQGSLAGVIQFSSSFRLEFNLLEYTDRASLLRALNPDLPYIRGYTNTAGALSLLLDSSQDGSMGLRLNHPHIAIVVTDGKSNIDEDGTIPFAQRIHASNIFQKVYTVGIGNFDVDELNAIASDPSLVFSTRDFDRTAIEQLQQELSQKLCTDAGSTYASYIVVCSESWRFCASS